MLVPQVPCERPAMRSPSTLQTRPRSWWRHARASTRYATKMSSRNDTEISCFMVDSGSVRHTMSMISAEFSNLMTAWRVRERRHPLSILDRFNNSGARTTTDFQGRSAYARKGEVRVASGPKVSFDQMISAVPGTVDASLHCVLSASNTCSDVFVRGLGSMFLSCCKNSGFLHASNHDNKSSNRQSKVLTEKDIPFAKPPKNFSSLREIRRPPLWSSGQSSRLQVQRSGIDSLLCQIFWEVVGLQRGPLSLVSSIE
jgi:hypothetical protein